MLASSAGSEIVLHLILIHILKMSVKMNCLINQRNGFNCFTHCPNSEIILQQFLHLPCVLHNAAC